jgi:hypothetical protein
LACSDALLGYVELKSDRSMCLMLQATCASVCNLRDNGRRMVERDGGMSYGSELWPGGRCLESKNDLNGSCCGRIGDIASVLGGGIEWAW